MTTPSMTTPSMTIPNPFPNIKYIVFNKEVITVYKDIDGLWRDMSGTVYAFNESTASEDPINRCGVGFFSLPTTNPLTDDCTPHDYAYSSPGFEAFHTRKEADQYLESLIEENPSAWSILAKPFYWIARILGSRYWENKDTNN